MSIIKEGGKIEYPQRFKQVTAYTDETPVIASNSTTMIDNNEQKVKTKTSMIICKSMDFSPSGMRIVGQLMDEWHEQESKGIIAENAALKLEVEKMKEALNTIKAKQVNPLCYGDCLLALVKVGEIAEQALKEN